MRVVFSNIVTSNLTFEPGIWVRDLAATRPEGPAPDEAELDLCEIAGVGG